MENFAGKNALLWQKLAVKVNKSTAPGDLQIALQCGVAFFHIECGLHTLEEFQALIGRCSEAIESYAKECQPWKVVTGIICELSGPQPRIKFNTGRKLITVTEGQRITLTGDVRYENQCFDEVKYVSNFDQLQGLSTNTNLSIGSVKLCVERIVPDFLTCIIERGGTLEPFSIVESQQNGNGKFDILASVRELECILENGCNFAMLPTMPFKSMYTMIESFRKSLHADRNIQLIATVDSLSLSNGFNKIEKYVNAVVTNSINTLKQLKVLKTTVLLKIEHGNEIPESIDDADVIILPFGDLNKVLTHLRNVNRMRNENLHHTNCIISPEDVPFMKCLDYTAKEVNASAIVLLSKENDSQLAIKISLMNPSRIVFVVKSSLEETNAVMLRKYLIPIVEPNATKISKQRIIQRAIAYGRRFDYLQSGNCIVTGFHIDLDSLDLAFEIRYVPEDSGQLSS